METKTPFEFILSSTNALMAWDSFNQAVFDDNALNQIALYAKTDGVRVEAARRLKNYDLLYSIALNANERKLREDIAGELSDQGKIENIYVKITKDYSYIEADVRDTLFHLVDKISTQNALADVALNAKSVLVRCRATDRLTDKNTAQKALEKLIRDDSVHDGIKFGRTVTYLEKKISEMS